MSENVRIPEWMTVAEFCHNDRNKESLFTDWLGHLGYKDIGRTVFRLTLLFDLWDELQQHQREK